MDTPRRRPFTDRGAPPKLTDETEKRLLEATRQSVPAEVAATYAGIGLTTFKRWCQHGREAEDKVEAAAEAGDEEFTLNAREQVYYDFWIKLCQARAESVTRGVLSVQRGAAGGTITEETTKTYRDPATGQVVEEKIVKKAPPDWRAAAWMLERGAAGRQFFHKDAMQVELTGANGGPVEVANVDADALSARVQANLAAARAAITTGAVAALDEGDRDGVVDAELVDE